MTNEIEFEKLVSMLIENNCIDCDHFWLPLNESDCLCMPVMGIIANDDEDAICTEWERQQTNLQNDRGWWNVEISYTDCDGRHASMLRVCAEDKETAEKIAETLQEVSPSAHDVWNVKITSKKIKG